MAAAALSLSGRGAGQYFVRVSGAATGTAYEMFFARAESASLAQGSVQLGGDRTDLGEIPRDTVENPYVLPAVQGGPRHRPDDPQRAGRGRLRPGPRTAATYQPGQGQATSSSSSAGAAAT
jgi:hypothetical protein